MVNWDALAYESQIASIKWLQFITLLFQGTLFIYFFLMESAGKQNKTKRVGIYIQTNTEKSGSSAIFHYISVAT